MLIRITNGSVGAGGKNILSRFSLTIKEGEKVGVVGPNGSGKTTLCRLLAGELSLDRDDKRQGPGIEYARSFSAWVLPQTYVFDAGLTVEAWFRALRDGEDLEARKEDGQAGVWGKPAAELAAREKKLKKLARRLGCLSFLEMPEQKARTMSSLSGGEQIRLRLLEAFLRQPELLILDEPTNHLDHEGLQALEFLIREYPGAVLTVSHDRFFLDQTAKAILECRNGTVSRYPGNYTAYKKEREKRLAAQWKAYEAQQEKIRQTEGLIERFKRRPNKAAMTRAKRSELKRLQLVEKPFEEGKKPRLLPDEAPARGSKWVWQAEDLLVGYDRPLAKVNLRIKRGQKIGVLGANGSGKSTLLKTIVGLLPPLGGKAIPGERIEIGYFAQTAEDAAGKEKDSEEKADQEEKITQEEKTTQEKKATQEKKTTVFSSFREAFPAMTEQEIRKRLGAFLFSGRDTAKPVAALSGGERVRLSLALLLTRNPNFLVLDEPTNHMDLEMMESLEEMLKSYEGTLLFVSHDRYFLKQVADSLAVFGEDAKNEVRVYPFGYEFYLTHRQELAEEDKISRVQRENEALLADLKAVPKKESHELPVSWQEESRAWELSHLAGKIAKAAEAWESAAEEEEVRGWMECLSEEDRIALENEGNRMSEPARMPLEQVLPGLLDTWTNACLKWYEAYEEG